MSFPFRIRLIAAIATPGLALSGGASTHFHAPLENPETAGIAQHANVDGRIAVDQHEVGQPARLDATRLDAEQIGIRRRCCRDGLERSESALDEQSEFL